MFKFKRKSKEEKRAELLNKVDNLNKKYSYLLNRYSFYGNRLVILSRFELDEQNEIYFNAVFSEDFNNSTFRKLKHPFGINTLINEHLIPGFEQYMKFKTDIKLFDLTLNKKEDKECKE